MPENAWVPAVTEAGEQREVAGVSELTNLDLGAWPAGTRGSCRRERLLASLGDWGQATETFREHLARVEERFGAGDPRAESIRAKLNALRGKT